MIYQPVNAYPNNTTVDVENTDGEHPLYFEWQFHGNYMTHCSIFIWDINHMEYGATELPCTFSTPIYGDDMVKVVWNKSSTLRNGTEYLWKVVQYEDNPTMFVKQGKVQATNSSSEVILQNDMHLWFNNNTQCYLIINGVKRRIKSICKVNSSIDVERTDTEMRLILESAFSFTPQKGVSYSIYTSGSATINGFYFKARTTPTVTVDFVNASDDLDRLGRLQYRLSNFKGYYQQREDVPIKYHYWQLYRIVGNKKELVIQTEDTYNSRLEFHFDGFVSEESYELHLNIVTQDGQYSSNDGGLRFKVFYNKPIMGDGLVSLSWNSDHNAARIDVQDIKVSRPTLSRNCKYEFLGQDRGILHIINGNIDYTKVSHENLSLNDFTLFSKFYLSPDKVGPIISLLFDPINGILRDSIYLSVDNEIGDDGQPTGKKYIMLHVVKNGRDITTYPYFSSKIGTKPCFQNTDTPDDLYEYVWPTTPISLDTFNTDAQFFLMSKDGSIADTFKLVVTPDRVYLRAIGAKHNYPIVMINISNSVYHCLRLYQDVFYDYNILLERTATPDEVDRFMRDDFIPSFGTFPDTIIYTPFTNGSLLSVNLEGVTENLDGYLVYREKIGEGIKHRVGVIDLSVKYIEDFMVTNDNIYKWELIPISKQEYGISIETEELMVRFDEWTIATYEPDEKEDNIYYVDKNSIWKFGLNIENHDIEQNILKQKLEGLGQYPKFSMQKRNYITGGLTAYLANMTNNDIYNTVAIKNRFPAYSPYRVASNIYWEPSDKLIEWNKLVASGKEVVIRDIKGHIWRAQIDSNNATVDVYAQTSPTTIDFTFTEIGSVDNCAIYLIE